MVQKSEEALPTHSNLSYQCTGGLPRRPSRPNLQHAGSYSAAVRTIDGPAQFPLAAAGLRASNARCSSGVSWNM
jgi:hypothetical protein